MKRVGNIYDKVCSFDNVRNAAIEAMRNKNITKQMKLFADNFDENCKTIALHLQNLNMLPCKYHTKTVYEPKERHILIAPFYWRVVHQAIVLQMKETWNKGLINSTYACIPHRGIHKAMRDVEYVMRTTKEPLYCLKMDVRKYFDNVDHSILKQIIERKIKDKRLLQLINSIIDSVDGSKGIPIGNLTSQYFANLYLSPLDYYSKHALKVKNYFRYMDDIVILHPSKKVLHEYLYEIKLFINNELKLELKNNYQVFPLNKRQLDFVGYRFDQHTTMLRKTILMKFYKNARKLRKKQNNEIDIKTQLSSHYGWINHLPEIHSNKIFNYAKTI